MDGKKWISCDACDKWNHTDCEIEHAGEHDSDMKRIATEFSKKQDSGIGYEENDGNYWCLNCRKKKAVQNQRLG